MCVFVCVCVYVCLFVCVCLCVFVRSIKVKGSGEYYNSANAPPAGSLRVGRTQYTNPEQSGGWRLRSSRDDLKTRKQVILIPARRNDDVTADKQTQLV